MTASTITRDEVAYLDEMDDDEFESTVLAHLSRDASSSTRRMWEAFCHHDLADRTLGCLVELQGRPGRNEAVEARLNLVRGRIRRRMIETDRVAYRDLLRELARGVNRHRLAVIAAELEPEPHDTALWDLLDELRLPCTDSDAEAGPTLAEMILDGPWREASTTTPSELLAQHGGGAG